MRNAVKTKQYPVKKLDTQQKRAEAALQESDEQFRSIVEDSHDGIMILDDAYRLIYVNDELCRISGYDREEVIGQDFRQFLDEEGKQLVAERYVRMQRGEEFPPRYELNIVCKDGQKRHVETSSSIIKDLAGREKIVAHTLDITERKQMETALRESEENFRRSMDESPLGIRIINPNTDETLYVNQALLEIYGYTSAEEFRADPVANRLTSESYNDYLAGREKTLRGERALPDKHEISIVRRDGGVRHLQVFRKDILWNGEKQNQSIYQDITEHKRAEEELQLRSELLDSISESVVLVGSEGKFLYVNEACCHTHGYSREELMKMNISQIEPALGRSAELQDKRRRSLMDGGEQVFETAHLRKDGSTFNVEVHSRAVESGGEKLILSIDFDITERKQNQEEMRRSNEKLSFMVKKLETQSRLNNMLSETRDLLQSCSNLREAGLIISNSVKKIFPGTQGALFLINESRSDVESVARWGDFPEDVDDNVFKPADCWGLRRGRTHIIDDAENGPICTHVRQVPTYGYMCLPLTARGNVIGLLHIKKTNLTLVEDTQSLSSMNDIAITLSEQLSLAISNVKLTESLSQQSIQDPLSRLYNRRYMEESLLHEIARAERKQTQIGVVMADLDNFKVFNDTYGHGAGDMLIAQVGRVFKQKIRGADIACRYGGEEFVIIIVESSIEDTYKRAEELREGIKNTEIVFQGQLLSSVTVSMGIATYPQNGSAVDNLLRAADTALYKAKQTGRDKVVIASI